MRFPTASNTPRPKRLNAKTRAWAWYSMHGAYGDEAQKNKAVILPESEAFEKLPLIDRQDAALLAVCREAPVRICEEELISGSATLGVAFRFSEGWHGLPALYKGKTLSGGANHLTLQFSPVLTEGINRYEQRIQMRMQDETLTPAQKRYLKSLQNAIDGMRIFHSRYLEATKAQKPAVHELLKQVPFSPARTFHEAVQSLWFAFVFTRLTGIWPGIGRMDAMLGPYLKKDLEEKRITLKEAREILASFMIKGMEWIENPPPGTGDAQHYQNLVLAGRDLNGNETANEVTYLILDIVEELGISDFPITMRLHEKTPEKLLRKIAQVMRHGGGVIAVYNEDMVFNVFRDQGYPEQEIPLFANDGCWEVQIPGCTNFSYNPLDALQSFTRAIGADRGGDIPFFSSMDEIYAAYIAQLDKDIEAVWQLGVGTFWGEKDGKWVFHDGDVPYSAPCDLFMDDCIENARAYYDFGPRYTVRSAHLGGAPDVGNSLYAIQKAVFEDHLLTFEDMVQCIRNNWEGREALRLMIKNRYTYYGNDHDESDWWHAKVLNDFADRVHICAQRHKGPIKFIPGVSTFGRQVDWLPFRQATAFGARKGDILSGNDSPTPGTDAAGVTAAIRSHCKADLRKQQCGIALDLKIFPHSLKGENGIQALKALLRGFVRENGFFLQLDTVDVKTLMEARQHPEQYKTLSVRVSGWNARFITLCEKWQDMVIERTAQGM